MSKPRVGSLFSGVEGFGMGLEAAGFEVTWQVEIDKDAVSVLERHYPTVRRYRDVREVNGAELSPVDVLVGGFPCQDLSVAGARRGLAGKRSGLFFEVARIAAETAAPWLLLENVPGLLSSFTPVEPPPSDVSPGAEWAVEETSDFGVVLSTLAEYGYGFCTRVLDAEYLGVPQRRERVFIVGCLGDTGARAASVLLEPESVLRDLAACLEAGQGAAGLPESGAGSGGVAGTLRSHPRPGSNDLGAIVSGEGVRNALTAHGGSHGRIDAESETFVVAAPLTAGGHPNSNMPGRHREDDENLVAFHATQSPVNGHVSPALGASSQIGVANLGVSHTLSTRSGATEDGTGRGTPRAAPRDGTSVRRLMPIECERLMGWPDGHTQFRADGSEIADGPRYRMIGNGVVAPVARWIGRRLMAALEIRP